MAITQSYNTVEGVLITKALFSYVARPSRKLNQKESPGIIRISDVDSVTNKWKILTTGGGNVYFEYIGEGGRIYEY